MNLSTILLKKIEKVNENPVNLQCVLECIDLLVAKYPDMIHQRDERQLLPFQVAIISKMEQPALKLIAMATVAEITTEKAGNYTSLSIAAGRGLYKVVQELLERGADPNFLDGEDNDIVALALACNNNNPMTVRCLAERTRLARLKVSKSQKQIFFFSFEPKTEQNYFLISAVRI